jgi:hypothetical protein
MTLSLYDALLATPPSQDEPLSPSAYLNTSYDGDYDATPPQASYLSIPSSGSSHDQSSSSPFSYSSSSYASSSDPSSSLTHRASPFNLLEHIERLDALDLARSTYHELLDWMSELALQAQSMNLTMNHHMLRERDRESAYLLQAEIRRVHGALIQQAEIVKDLQRVLTNTTTRASSSTTTSPSSSSLSGSSRSSPFR